MKFGMEYGGADDVTNFSSFKARNDFFVKGQRKRLNIIAVLVALFVPWLLFCFVFVVLSFKLHYTDPSITYGLATLAFLGAVCLPALLAGNALKRKATDPTYQPSWYVFLAGTCFLAFAIGAQAGQANYSNYMTRYYSLTHLAHYEDVDTNVYLGQQLMDAGHIDFKKGTVLDTSRSMGFKNHDVYCVTPIVTKGSANKPQSVDFWAVGKNCCSGVSADFHCEGFSDQEASGAIRMMKDEDRPFYRLAVQQAEATYKMTATHPLFFEWVRSGTEATNRLAQKGNSNCFLGICSYFVFQSFLTAAATVLFSKLVHF